MIELLYPLSINRYWTISAKTRSIIPTQEGRRWKQQAQQIARLQWPRDPLTGEVVVKMTFHPRIFLPSGRKAGRRIDIDNALKLGLDSLQGICYQDDAQIVDLSIKVAPKTDHGALMAEVESA